jgi:hypothetical protein
MQPRLLQLHLTHCTSFTGQLRNTPPFRVAGSSILPNMQVVALKHQALQSIDCAKKLPFAIMKQISQSQQSAVWQPAKQSSV